MQVIVQPAVADSAGQADGDAVASRLQIAATSTDRLWMAAHRGRFVIRLPPLSTAVQQRSRAVRQPAGCSQRSLAASCALRNTAGPVHSR
jgi:hypothetical protein